MTNSHGCFPMFHANSIQNEQQVTHAPHKMIPYPSVAVY